MVRLVTVNSETDIKYTLQISKFIYRHIYK